MSRKQVGRLAMRAEGEWWVGYYALPHTMEGAIELGRVAMTFVQDNSRREIFMLLMQEAVSDILQERGGSRPKWNEPTRAPEHERKR